MSQQLVQEIRFHCQDPRPGLSVDEIRSFEQVLGGELLGTLRLLYADHDGESEFDGLPMRLMTAAEAMEAQEFFVKGGYTPEKAALFWTDDQSNYAGAFLANPMADRVFFLSHDEPDTSPRFRSVNGFLVALLSGAKSAEDWFDLPTDYPRTEAVPAVEADDTLAADLLSGLDALPEHQRAQVSMYVLNLLSPARVDLVTPFLRSDDMWVQERACEVLGAWKCVEAVDELVRVAQGGMHNGKTAAVLALKKIRTPEAAGAVKRLKSSMGKGYEWLFR